MVLYVWLNRNDFCDDNVMCFGVSCLRASWLKESNPGAEQLFSMVAEVFIFWAKSHVRMTHSVFFFPLMSILLVSLYVIFTHSCLPQQNFKWEEQNYVVQNEINNLVFLVNNDKMSKVSQISEINHIISFFCSDDGHLLARSYKCYCKL